MTFTHPNKQNPCKKYKTTKNSLPWSQRMTTRNLHKTQGQQIQMYRWKCLGLEHVRGMLEVSHGRWLSDWFPLGSLWYSPWVLLQSWDWLTVSGLSDLMLKNEGYSEFSSLVAHQHSRWCPYHLIPVQDQSAALPHFQLTPLMGLCLEREHKSGPGRTKAQVLPQQGHM